MNGDHLGWSAGSVLKQREAREGERNFAMLLGLLSHWEESWSCALETVIGADVAVWPYSVGMLVKIASFLVHWSSELRDLGWEVFLVLSYSLCMSSGEQAVPK